MALLVKIFDWYYPISVTIQTQGLEIKTRIFKILDISGVTIDPSKMNLRFQNRSVGDTDSLSNYFLESRLFKELNGNKDDRIILDISVMDDSKNLKDSDIDSIIAETATEYGFSAPNNKSQNSDLQNNNFQPSSNSNVPKPKRTRKFPRGTSKGKNNHQYWILDPNEMIPTPMTTKKILFIESPK